MKKHGAVKKIKVAIAVATIIVIFVCLIFPIIYIMTDKSDSTYPDSRHTLLRYFNLVDGIDINWAHAINSHSDLLTALNDSTMVIEADVLLNGDGVPIMAHPPAVTSDINLQTWLEKVFSFSKKGLKLDFKSTNVLLKAIEICQVMIKRYNNSDIPIILNADIFEGPNNNITQPVDALQFIKVSSSIQNAILSPGWTTKYIGNLSEGYTWENTKEMHNLVRNLSQDITFPIRASLVSKSLQQLVWLMEQNPHSYTITVWTSKTDNYDVKELQPLRKYKTRVYYDLPADEILLLKSYDSFL